MNNAMTMVFTWSWDVEPDEYRRATEVTCLGQVYGTLDALRRIKPRNRGRIVNVGSSLAYIGILCRRRTARRNSAARGFSESVRAELLHQDSDVTLSMVRLPGINTPQFGCSEARLPQPPPARPADLQPRGGGPAHRRRCIRGRRSKMLGGWNKLIFAGIKVAPAVLTHFTARTGVMSQQTGEQGKSARRQRSRLTMQGRKLGRLPPAQPHDGRIVLTLSTTSSLWRRANRPIVRTESRLTHGVAESRSTRWGCLVPAIGTPRVTRRSWRVTL